LQYFDIDENELEMWSLSGSGVIYGEELEMTHKPLSAVIDTGTTMLMVPKNIFSVLVEEW
jgi:hypothetical protein